MKRSGVFLLVCLMLVLGVAGTALAMTNVATIQSGTIEYSSGHYLAGEPIAVGFDAYGYNYQAHMFRGSYANSYLGAAGFPAYEGDDAAYLADNPTVTSFWAWPYRDVQLEMKWNDAWIANTDATSDHRLDRHYGFPSYIGSGAWLTNHQTGTYPTGEKWTYFSKIVAAPSDATKSGGVWYAANGTEIGSDIWGEFASIQEVSIDPVDPLYNYRYVSPFGPGFGKF